MRKLQYSRSKKEAMTYSFNYLIFWEDHMVFLFTSAWIKVQHRYLWKSNKIYTRNQTI